MTARKMSVQPDSQTANARPDRKPPIKSASLRTRLVTPKTDTTNEQNDANAADETTDLPATTGPDTPPRHGIGGRDDVANARRFVTMHRARFRYVPKMAVWYRWDGYRWAEATEHDLLCAARQMADGIYRETAAIADARDQADMAAWAKTSHSRAGMQNAIAVAVSFPNICVDDTDFDTDPMLFNVRNGTIDLRTGELRPHRPADYITKRSPVLYDPNATLPEWDAFLADTVNGEAPMLDFLRRAAGYTLTGGGAEEMFFVVHGPSRTGKGTFLESLAATLGEYSVTLGFNSLLTQKNTGGPRPDLLALRGARLAIASEGAKGMRFDTPGLKRIVGRDTISERDLYRKPSPFVVQAVLWLATNERPQVDPKDDAMFERLKEIPFDRTVPKERRDPGLKTLLKNTRRAGPAILAWAVRGALDWQRDGLKVPERVEQATAEYKDEMDPLRDWLADECLFAPDARVQPEPLRRSYEKYAGASGTDPMTPHDFKLQLEGRGLKQGRVGKKGTRFWLGIGLLADRDTPNMDATGGDVAYAEVHTLPDAPSFDDATSEGGEHV